VVIGLAVVLVVASALVSRALGGEVASAAGPCTFAKAQQPYTVAFCDSFNQGFAQVNGSREGSGSGLDPQVWGASRVIAGDGGNFASGNNPSQGEDDNFAPVTTTADDCGGSRTVVPDNDIQICNATLFDSTNDDGGQTVLAMYPKQPFDIAGRTGDVTFNVSDNSQGIHAAWPTFVYTDQPVPAPYSALSGIQTSARNSFGISFAQQCSWTPTSSGGSWCPDNDGQGNCTSSPNGVSVDSMFETTNYTLSPVSFNLLGCVAKSTSPTQQNHVEIQLSSTGAVVWASDPGSTVLKEIAAASFTMPLSRGLVWMEDAHYNGDKFNSQQSNTFGWSDLGFDGPVEARDVGYDVPNNGALDGAAERLGWATGTGTADPLTVTAPGVSAQALSHASGALVVFNWMPATQSVPSISVNGNPYIATAWPFTNSSTGTFGGNNDETYVWRTMAVQVPLSRVQAGNNAITFENAPYGFANVSLILQGAGGVPSCVDPSTCSSSAPTSKPSSTPLPTPTPTSTGVPTPHPSPSTSPVSSPTPTPGARHHHHHH